MIFCQILILSKYDILVSLWGSQPWKKHQIAKVEVRLRSFFPQKSWYNWIRHIPLHLPYMPSFLDPVHHGDAGAFNLHIFSNCLFSTSIWCMDLKSQYLWHHVVFGIPMNIYESSGDFHFPHPAASKVLSRLWGKKSAGNRKGSQRLEKVPLVSVLLFCDPPTT